MKSVNDVLADARSVRELARGLGEACLAELTEIDEVLTTKSVRELVTDVVAAVVAVSPAWWDDERRTRAGYLDLTQQPAVNPALELLVASGPAAHVAVLRGLCAGPLARYYAQTLDCVEMRRGDPVPPLLRPTHTAIADATPRPLTMQDGHVLYPTGFSLFPGAANRPVRVELDYTRRIDLDTATWLGDQSAGRFPLVATIHPWGRAADLEIAEIGPDTFFGVAPRAWDEEAALRTLKSTRAGIVLGPELCLPDPSALRARINAQPQAFPRLVVAGSAHAVEPREDGESRRVNAVEVLLDGELLMTHRKIRPFVADYLGKGHTGGRWREQIDSTTATLRIPSGTYTRLGVVICADLNDAEIQNLLQAAGVNLLLVPALTPKDGAFAGAMSRLASTNQAVSVIVNGTPLVQHRSRAAPPLVLAGVPRARPGEQTAEFGARWRGRRAIGHLDVNKPLRQAIHWSP